ncbi:hypothetical protein [Caballeronia grimmiae]|uniref:hypothetical protein n=1 Tax=Caballeronia grimmiae TaxID=1071679 RepID=UPI0038B87441
MIDDEVRRMLAKAHDRVRKTLGQKKPLLEKIARLLLTHEVVDHAALQAVMNENVSSAQEDPHREAPAPATVASD